MPHTFERGDGMVFVSHKYHSVSTLEQGTRHVLVLELWEGTENHHPSRAEAQRWQGEWRTELEADERRAHTGPPPSACDAADAAGSA